MLINSKFYSTLVMVLTIVAVFNSDITVRINIISFIVMVFISDYYNRKELFFLDENQNKLTSF